MKTLTAIIGALALTAFGCGDSNKKNRDDNPVYSGVIANTEQTSSFKFSGRADYCVSEREQSPVASTCIKVYVKVDITADEAISKAWTAMYRDSRSELKSNMVNGNNTNHLEYTWITEMCVLGNLTGIELFAEDVKGGAGKLLFQEVDCRTLDNMIN